MFSFYEAALRVLFGYDAFVSYSRADGEIYANALYSKLSDRNYTVFLDRHEDLYGDELQARLKAVSGAAKLL